MYVCAGPEKLKLFAEVDISVLLPGEPASVVATIQSLWVQLLDINRSLSLPPGETTPATVTSFEERAKAWVDLFCQVYQINKVTPYIHAMHAHVGQFLSEHGSLLPFTQQGLEKYNDKMTRMFFRLVVGALLHTFCALYFLFIQKLRILHINRATNMRSREAMFQLLEKSNRLETFRDDGLGRQLRTVACRNCSLTGHYHLTCQDKCSNCGFSPYSAHLVNYGEGKRVPQCCILDE
jgi:hypothetical protein